MSEFLLFGWRGQSRGAPRRHRRSENPPDSAGIMACRGTLDDDAKMMKSGPSGAVILRKPPDGGQEPRESGTY